MSRLLDFDVAIVGYGPVGATLANFLGQAGWKTAVIERNKEIYPIPRAVHVDDETIRIWQAADVLREVEPSFGGYPHKRQYINAKSEIFFETYLRTERPFGFQSDMYFHQPTLEAGLRAGVARYPHVVPFLERTFLSFEQNETHVTLTLDDGQQLTARYLVGCDGASSSVRKQLAIPFRDLNFEQPWLVVDFYLKPGETRESVGLAYAHQQYCNPAQPKSYIPTAAHNHYRWEFMLLEGQTKAEVEQPDYVRRLLETVLDITKVEVVRSAVYTFHSLIATRWRQGRVFIAGDAAHQMPPFAGQGMCSGLRDVHNLSWKLHLVLASLANEALLDSYEQERKPHVTRMTRGTMFLGNLVQTRSQLQAFLRDFLFKTILRIPAVFGRLARFALRAPNLQTSLQGGDKKGLVGTYFIQPLVRQRSGEVVMLDDVLGNGFAIVGCQLSPFNSETNDGAVPFQFVRVVLQPDALEEAEETTAVYDEEGVLEAWFADTGVDFVVIRPDRYVFGGYTAQSAGQIMKELEEALQVK